MAYFCYFSFAENLDSPDFLQKKFYNINYRSRKRQIVEYQIFEKKTVSHKPKQDFWNEPFPGPFI